MRGTWSLHDPILSRPLRDDIVWDISKHDMEMLETAHALQGRPILEPKNMASHILARKARVPLQALRKSPRDEVFNQRARLVRDVAILRLHGNGRLGPDNQVTDPRRDTVGPVIAEDLEVCWIGKRDRILERDHRVAIKRDTVLLRDNSGRWVWLVPSQALLADVVGDAAILRFDAICPRDVSAEIGRLPPERPEVVASWVRP